MTKQHIHPTGHVGLIDLPVVADPRGDLTFIEGERHVPFPVVLE